MKPSTPVSGKTQLMQPFFTALRLRGFRIVPLTIAVACFVLLRAASAVTPAPDGGYPSENTAEGTDALFNLTTGSSNTAVGFQAAYGNTTGTGNTATGDRALWRNTTGYWNTAIGVSALQLNTTGYQNTVSGFAALINNTTGFQNTATGFEALQSNGDGNYNTANGVYALYSNSSGHFNTATGFQALAGFNLPVAGNGSDNTATGANTLFSNDTGNNNTASGNQALYSNNTGNDNTASGANALLHNSKGNGNTSIGFGALQNNTTGSSNVALGNQVGVNVTTGSNNIYIGTSGPSNENGKIRIGTGGTQKQAYIAGIYGGLFANGVQVVASPQGRLGTVSSSERFKETIKPMDKASESILALQPVTFRYKPEFDPDGIPQFGLIAEQVEKVNPDLVVRGEDGKVNTVRYEAVNAMLLNEFLKEHRQVEEQKAGLAEMKSVVSKQEELIAKQQKQIETLTATVRKVSDQISLSKPSPQLVANP